MNRAKLANLAKREPRAPKRDVAHPSISDADFARLIESHRPAMLACAYRLLGSVEEVQDCVQDAALKAWRGRDSFRASEAFGVWIRAVTRSSAFDIQRSGAARHRESLFSQRPTPAGQRIGDSNGDKDQSFGACASVDDAQIMGRSRQRQIAYNPTETPVVDGDLAEWLLARLPPETADMFRMVAAGEDCIAIVDKYGIPAATVRTKIHRARKRLQVIYAEILADAPGKSDCSGVGSGATQ